MDLQNLQRMECEICHRLPNQLNARMVKGVFECTWCDVVINTDECFTNGFKSQAWKAVKKNGALCHYCKEFTKSPTRDHVIPKSKGGTLIVISCGWCNQNKGLRSYSGFVNQGVKKIKMLKRSLIKKQKE